MISVLTYNAPHQKTQDLLFRLLSLGYKEKITVIATPWIEKKSFKPIFKHRPNHPIPISPEIMCKNLGIPFILSESADLPKLFTDKAFEHNLIGGAGILPEELALNFKIINSHPAYLPYVRGLDALKWAIYKGDPIGVTLHYIDNKADEGLLIDRVTVPLYYEDTFHSFAFRQYEFELNLLAASIIKVKEIEKFESLADERYLPNRRMPHHLEIKMIKRFEELRENSPSWITLNETF
jgi:hypothetical protein